MMAEREKAERQCVEGRGGLARAEAGQGAAEIQKGRFEREDYRGAWLSGRGRFVRSILSRDSETFKLVWKSVGSLPGYAYVGWTPPAIAIDGETYHIVGYECGVFELNGSRYRRITTDKRRALQYFNDPLTDLASVTSNAPASAPKAAEGFWGDIR